MSPARDTSNIRKGNCTNEIVTNSEENGREKLPKGKYQRENYQREINTGKLLIPQINCSPILISHLTRRKQNLKCASRQCVFWAVSILDSIPLAFSRKKDYPLSSSLDQGPPLCGFPALCLCPSQRPVPAHQIPERQPLRYTIHWLGVLYLAALHFKTLASLLYHLFIFPAGPGLQM